jgi:hypothetical protein
MTAAIARRRRVGSLSVAQRTRICVRDEALYYDYL